jgi:hypothetical protein
MTNHTTPWKSPFTPDYLAALAYAEWQPMHARQKDEQVEALKKAYLAGIEYQKKVTQDKQMC